MADSKQSGDPLSDLAMAAAETGVKEMVKLLIGPAASTVFTVISKTGIVLTSIWLEQISSGEETKKTNDDEEKTPPFSIIGLGRCGTHVTAHVARMVLDSLSSADASVRHRSTLLGRWFDGKKSSKLTLEPLMIVGDLDPTTLTEIEGLVALAKDGTSRPSGEETFKRILKIGYDPLSVSGAGHLPIVAQFITRCLLALPPDKSKDGSAWARARNYLLDTSSGELNPTRIIFYIFSSGGGSGGGSAPELMRAQRVASFVSGAPDPEMYYCGVAVIPYDQSTSKTHEINTGRLFTQYLADLNIALPDRAAFYRSTQYEYAVQAKSERNEGALRPWNGLAVISNETLRPADKSLIREDVESNSNQYIAQQIFNLASGQISVLNYERTGDLKLSQLNFQSVRMDPADLKNGLVGPFAVGFSVTSSPPSSGNNWIDCLILKALSSPALNESLEPASKLGFVQGLSISPEEIGSEEQRTYDSLMSNLLSETSEKNSAGLNSTKVEYLRGVPLFKRCPKVIFVFTAPQVADIPGNVDRRIGEVLSWIMPNLNQPRYAIVRGTTSVYTLSVFMQGSVVLCPEVLQAISSYLYLCWNTRTLDHSAFNELWEKLMYEDPPLDDLEIEKHFGEYEALESEFEDYLGSIKNYEQNWEKTIGMQKDISNSDIECLKRIKARDCRVNFREVAAAIRYLRFIHNVESRVPPRTARPR